MKILAAIPVEKIRLSPVTYTFRSEIREVEVVRVLRYPATRYPHLKRYYYMADLKRHPDLHPDATCTGLNGLFRTNIVRRGLNDKWVPPVFPEDKDGYGIFVVEEGGAQ